MGISGVLSQLFGGGSSCGGEKGWYRDTTANNADAGYTSPDGSIHYPSGVSVDGIGGLTRRRTSLAKRLDLVRLAALVLTLGVATQPRCSVQCAQQ